MIVKRQLMLGLKVKVKSAVQWDCGGDCCFVCSSPITVPVPLTHQHENELAPSSLQHCLSLDRLVFLGS